MLIGNPSRFALESVITQAYERPSLLALGFFVIHIMDRCYGVKEPGAAMLANSVGEVGSRIAERGLHDAPFANEDALQVGNAFRRAIYDDCEEHEMFFGMSVPEFAGIIHSKHLMWAPDGDEAFDDGSYVLQFDVEDRVRLIAFVSDSEGLVDASTLRDVWLPADEYYGILKSWRDAFNTEWDALLKKD